MLMKPPVRTMGTAGAKGHAARSEVYAPPTPRVSRQKAGKVLSAAERAAFLASRPDLKTRS